MGTYNPLDGYQFSSSVCRFSPPLTVRSLKIRLAKCLGLGGSWEKDWIPGSLFRTFRWFHLCPHVFFHHKNQVLHLHKPMIFWTRTSEKQVVCEPLITSPEPLWPKPTVLPPDKFCFPRRWPLEDVAMPKHPTTGAPGHWSDMSHGPKSPGFPHTFHEILVV